jgi:hypothetical protein
MILRHSYREFISSNVNASVPFGFLLIRSDRILNPGPDLYEFELLDPEMFEYE